MINPISSKGHIPSLDGWRGIAILLVLFRHGLYTKNLPSYNLVWIDKVFDANLGVRIFFVLSGFLITLLLLRESNKNGKLTLRNFYLRRVFRIFPVYFIYLFAILLLTYFAFYQESFSSWVGCLTFSRNMIGQGQSLTVHFWSLAVEEQFYIIWPLVFAFLSLWRRQKLYFIILLFPVIICPIFRFYFNSHTPGGDFLDRLLGERSILMYADSLSVGCIGAWFAWKIPYRSYWSINYSLILMVALLTLVSGRLMQTACPAEYKALCNAIVPSFQAWAILSLLWLTASTSSPGFVFLNSKPMALLGILSYSIYVWHVLFLSNFAGFPLNQLFFYDWRLWFIPTFLISILSYYFIEKPMIRFGQSFRNT